MKPPADDAPPRGLAAARLIALATIAWWVAGGLGLAVGGIVGVVLPCSGEGFACLGPPIYGALLGALVGAVAVAFVGARLGLRWWWVPLSLALVLGALPWGIAWLTGGALVLAPATAAATALPRASGRRWRLVPVLVLVAAATATSVALLVTQRQEHQAVERELVATGVQLLAPVDRDDLRLTRVGTLGGVVRYTVAPRGQPREWVRVSLDDGPPSPCEEREKRDCTQLAGDVQRQSFAGDPVRYVVERGGAVAVIESGGRGEWGAWSDRDLRDLAGSLQVTDAAWLVDHAAD